MAASRVYKFSSPYQYCYLQKLVKEGSVNGGSKRENMQYLISFYEMLGGLAHPKKLKNFRTAE